MLPLPLVCFYEKRKEVDREPLRLFSAARNRFALRLAGHQIPRQVVRDGTAGESLTFYTILFTKFYQDILKQAKMEYGRGKKK